MALPGIPISKTECIGDSLQTINNALTALDFAVINAGASVAIQDTPPTSPSPGDLWYDSSSGVLSVYYNDGDSSQWVVTVPGGGGATGASVTVDDVAPTSPSEGDLWYNSTVGILYLYYNDGTSTQWVDVGGGDAGSSPEIANLQTQINTLSTNMQNIGNYPYLEYAWVTAPNAAGQTITANTITTLTIDTEVADTGNFGSITSNQITLSAGTYQFEANTHASAATNIGGNGTLALYNITDNSYVSRGSSQSGGSDNNDNPILKGQFTVTTQKTFDLRYYNANAGAATCYIKNTISNETSTLNTANAEQRTTIKLWKVG